MDHPPPPPPSNPTPRPLLLLYMVFFINQSFFSRSMQQGLEKERKSNLKVKKCYIKKSVSDYFLLLNKL